MDVHQTSSAVHGLSKRLFSDATKATMKKDAIVIGIFILCVLLPLSLAILWFRRRMMRRREEKEAQWYGAA